MLGDELDEPRKSLVAGLFVSSAIILNPWRGRFCFWKFGRYLNGGAPHSNLELMHARACRRCQRAIRFAFHQRVTQKGSTGSVSPKRTRRDPAPMPVPAQNLIPRARQLSSGASLFAPGSWGWWHRGSFAPEQKRIRDYNTRSP